MLLRHTCMSIQFSSHIKGRTQNKGNIQSTENIWTRKGGRRKPEKKIITGSFALCTLQQIGYYGLI
jgi:hypothetical protein